MNLTTYGANAILDGTAMPATLYVKLHVGDPGPSAALNPFADTTRPAFTRTAAVDGGSTNENEITWSPSAGEASLSHASVWDAATAGNPWWVGALSEIAPIGIGGYLVLDIGELSLSFDIWGT